MGSPALVFGTHQHTPTVVALQHIRRMRGGAQSHLMRCSDRNLYVVKFQNNPQHIRVLANEFIVTRLASLVGLPIPEAAVVEVGESLIQNTAELCVQVGENSIPCAAGLNFGSCYAVDPLKGQLFDYLPLEMFSKVRNPETFAGMLAFDKWVGNIDNRQAIFSRRMVEHKYRVSFIDHGYCFNVGDWDFHDKPLRGAYVRNEVYCNVRDWEAFEPWLSRIEGIGENLLWSALAATPPEWYGDDCVALEKLAQALFERRGIVRELITAFRNSNRHPFPLWGQKQIIWNDIPDLEQHSNISGRQLGHLRMGLLN